MADNHTPEEKPMTELRYGVKFSDSLTYWFGPVYSVDETSYFEFWDFANFLATGEGPLLPAFNRELSEDDRKEEIYIILQRIKELNVALYIIHIEAGKLDRKE